MKKRGEEGLSRGKCTFGDGMVVINEKVLQRIKDAKTLLKVSRRKREIRLDISKRVHCHVYFSTGSQSTNWRKILNSRVYCLSLIHI